MKKERVFISNTLLVRRVIDTLSLHGHNHLITDVLDLVKSKVWVLEGMGTLYIHQEYLTVNALLYTRTHAYTHYCTDLRQLACTLFLRGEVESGFIIVRCLESYNAVPTVLGQAAIHGMVLNQKPLDEILSTIAQFSEMTSLSVPVKVSCNSLPVLAADNHCFHRIGFCIVNWWVCFLSASYRQMIKDPRT